MPELEPAEQLDQSIAELVLAPPARHMPATRPTSGPKETLVERASVEDRLVYVLEERAADLEMRLREQYESAQLRSLEMRALELDLQLKEQYIGRLEGERAQAVAACEASDAQLSETARQLGEVSALATAIQNQIAYKFSVKAVTALKQTGPLYRVLRSGARVVLGR